MRLRVRICRGERCVEGVAVANTGFAGGEPEITLPQSLAPRLLGESVQLAFVERILADGSRVALARTSEKLDVYLVTGEGLRGPVGAHAYLIPSGVILLNDKLLSELGVVVIDPWEGIWCFREEIGKRERRGL